MKQSGFTLIENLLAILLILVLASFAFSSGQKILIHEQLKMKAKQIKAIFLDAQSNNENIIICPSQNGKECSHIWKGDLIVKTTKDVLHVYQHYLNDMLFTWKGFAYSKCIVFSNDLDKPYSNGSLEIQKAHQKIFLVIDRIGRIQIKSF